MIEHPTVTVSRASGLLLLALLVLAHLSGLLAGCSEDGAIRPGGDASPFVVTESMSVVLNLAAGAERSDSLTGLTFRFPRGATGTLTTGTLAEAPDRPWDAGRGFYVTLDGAEPLELLLPHDSTGYEFLLGYGTPHGSHQEGRAERWYALPPDDTLDAGDQSRLLFALATSSEPGTDCEGGRHYWLCEFATGSEVAQELEDAIAEATELLAIWQDSLAATFAGVTGARTPAELPAMYFPDGSYYRGFRRSCDSDQIAAAPRIGLQAGATRGEIAHQIGHYLTHLLVGDEAYREIETHLPAVHGIGEFSADRAALTEDYAHFFAHILTGMIEGAADPAAPQSFFPGGAPSPRDVDLPALDGFGTLLLHVLQRTDSTIVNVRGDTVRVPIVGLARDEIIRELIAPGLWSMDDFRDLVAGYLAASGREECLAPLAAAVGWLPSGWGQVVGRTWAPLGDAAVRAYTSVGGAEFYAASEPVLSDSLGWFIIRALFPGAQRLRVTTDTDVQEYELEAAWQNGTDRNVSINKLFLWPDLRTLNGLGVTLYLTFGIAAGDAATDSVFRAVGDMHCDGLQGIFERDGVYVPQPVNFEEIDPQAAWVLDTLDISYSLETGEIVDYYIRARREVSGTHTLEVRAVDNPLIWIGGSRSLLISNLPGVPSERIQEQYDLTLTGPAGDVYTEDDLTGGGQILVVKAFRK